MAAFTSVYLHRSVKHFRRAGLTSQGLTTLAKWTYDSEGACMCHIFLVLHFQIGQPILGTNLVFYSIMVVFLASQMLPEAGPIIFLSVRRSALFARFYQCHVWVKHSSRTLYLF